MAALKTETMTVRIEPAVKQGLKALAAREHRSIANMVEVLIRDYCARNDISIPERDETTTAKSAVATSRVRNR